MCDSLWNDDDLAQVLAAADQANLEGLLALSGCETLPPTPLDASKNEVCSAYRSGFTAALATIALAFGLGAPAAEKASDTAGEG